MAESPVSAQALLRAALFAAEKHRAQRRKDADASPYINHPLAVAEVLARQGVTDGVALQSALLHDTIEDTETSLEELTREFGLAVASVVLEVSDDKGLDKAERKRLQIEHSVDLSLPAKLVKLGDKICNVLDVTHRPPADWPLERRRTYLDWTERVVFGCRGAHEGLERLYDSVLAEGRAMLAGGGHPPPEAT